MNHSHAARVMRAMDATLTSAPWMERQLSLLQRHAIRPNTTLQYINAIMNFAHWLTTQPRTSAMTGRDRADQLLVQFFDTSFREGAQPALGSKTLAALLHLYPEWGGSLRMAFPRASRALKGWQALCPHQTRQPLPLYGLTASVGILVSSGEIAQGLALLLGFTCYLRPRELTSLLVSQLVPPLRGHRHLQQWSLLLHPEEGQQPSKAGYFDEGIRLDSPWLTWMAPFFTILTEHRDPTATLWPFTHEELIRSLKRACAHLALDHMRICLYSLRHGGASHDSLHDLRSLPEIKDRGRWADDRSLRRYRKETRARLELFKLPDDVLLFGQSVYKHLDNIFRNPTLMHSLIPLLRARPRA